MKKKDNTNDQKIYLGKVIQNLQRPASNSSSFDDEMPKESNDMSGAGGNEIIPNYYEANPQKWATTEDIGQIGYSGRGCEFCVHEHVYGKWMEFHHDGDSSESVEIPAKFCPNCGRRLEK